LGYLKPAPIFYEQTIDEMIQTLYLFKTPLDPHTLITDRAAHLIRYQGDWNSGH
jgi:hypothetical protein